MLRILEARLSAKRAAVRFPDKERRRTKEVDLYVEIGDAKFAIEHTLIEPLDGFIESAHHFEGFVREFDQLVAGKVPTEHEFQLLVPVTALNGIRNKEVPSIKATLSAYVVERMASLASNPADDLETVRPDGVPFSVKLVRVRNPRPARLGTLHVIRYTEDDIRPQRVRRLERAIEEKAKKLRQYKKNNCTTVLVLESNDIALTNDYLVMEALTQALSNVDPAPDEAFLADTCSTYYTFRQLIVGGRENDASFENWDEFEARDLDP